MKGVPVISALPVQGAEPVTDGATDELRDKLVPVQEDELPQGVLELMATLVLRHRPAMEAGRALAGAQGTLEVERDEVRPAASLGMPYPQVGPLLHKPMPQSVRSAITVEPLWVERQSITVEPPPVERTAMSSGASAPIFDTQRSEALPNLQAERQAPLVARPAVPAPATPQALPPSATLHRLLETLPGPDRGLLQVPFNKGAVSGQVTISRVADEPARNLQLNPSNAQVFEQLKVSLEQVREPVWRLTDSGGEQQRQGSHRSPDDEQDEHPEHPA